MKESVLVNDEMQYSLWPTFASVPSGWSVVLADKSHDECVTYIEEIWTDMRPRSLAEKMSQAS